MRNTDAHGHTRTRTERRAKALPLAVPRAAFTLIEMMMVIALASILMAMLASSLIQARNHARKTKAEAQLREMASAFIQFYNTYGDWPSGVKGQTDVEISEELLDPLTASDNGENPLGTIFLNKTFTEVEKEKSRRLHGGVLYLDPWDEPYRMSFQTVDLNADIVHTVSVWFPNKNRRW